jgi:hypothetical protein
MIIDSALSVRLSDHSSHHCGTTHKVFPRVLVTLPVLNMAALSGMINQNGRIGSELH